jgi:hypothetical protein
MVAVLGTTNWLLVSWRQALDCYQLSVSAFRPTANDPDASTVCAAF